MDIFSRVCLAFGLTINLKKTKVMYTPPTGQVHVEPNIKVFHTFAYFLYT